MGAGPFDIYKHVVWPACLPGIFTSLRIATGTVVAVLFFAESIASYNGVGKYFYTAWSMANNTKMSVAVIVLALMGILLYEGFDLLERKLCRWRAEVNDG